MDFERCKKNSCVEVFALVYECFNRPVFVDSECLCVSNHGRVVPVDSLTERAILLSKPSTINDAKCC